MLNITSFVLKREHIEKGFFSKMMLFAQLTVSKMTQFYKYFILLFYSIFEPLIVIVKVLSHKFNGVYALPVFYR